MIIKHKQCNGQQLNEINKNKTETSPAESNTKYQHKAESHSEHN